MEIAGFGVGVISLVGLFSTFFDIYEKISAIKDMSEDLRELQECLRWESERVKYVNKKYDVNCLDASKQPLLEMTMLRLNKQLADIRDAIPKIQSIAHPNDSKSKSGGKKSLLTRVPSVLRWVAVDKANMNQKLARLHDTTDSLWLFVLTEAEGARMDFVLRSDAISHPHQAAIMHASQYSDIWNAARVKRLLEASLSGQAVISEHAPNSCIPVESIHWQEGSSLNHAASAPWTKGFYNNEAVIVEWRGPFMGDSVARPAAGQRLHQLCNLLQAMYSAGRQEETDQAGTALLPAVHFAQLQCVGWTLASRDSFARIGLVFHYPAARQQRPTVQPRSLRDCIRQARHDGSAPPLGERFNLAYGVCTAVANIISIGWTHRAIRSENMLTFNAGDSALSSLYMIGFTYARPGDSATEFSDLPQGKDWAFYRPAGVVAEYDTDESDESDFSPEYLTSSPTSYTTAPDGILMSRASIADDMYGLGIVLLEIGLWTTAQDMVKDRKLETFRNKGLPLVITKLASRCGTIYQDVVRKCLDKSNWEDDKKTNSLGEILERLKLCHA